jgi:hypothetical protein
MDTADTRPRANHDTTHDGRRRTDQTMDPVTMNHDREVRRRLYSMINVPAMAGCKLHR